MGNYTVERAESAKYLGVTLDEYLNWEAHIDLLKTQITKTLNAFKIIKNYIPTENKIQLYYAYIYSRIKYGIEVYGRANTLQMHKLQVKQNRCLKTLFNKDFLTPTKAMHKELQVLMIPDIEKLHILKFVHLQRNNMTPDVFYNLFIPNHTVHGHNTRQTCNLHLHRTHNAYGKKTTKFYGAQLWNSIPAQLRMIESNGTFGKHIKKSLLDSY